MTSSSLFCRSSSPLGRGRPIDPIPMPSEARSKPPNRAAAEGLSKFMGAGPGWLVPIRATVAAGDFLNCCGDDLGPWGEKAGRFEYGVEADAPGVAAAPCCEGCGVLPCCEGACFMGCGVVILSLVLTMVCTIEKGGGRLSS